MSKGCETLVEMRWRPRSFCRVSTGDSYIFSSCDMNDEPALSLCSEVWHSFEAGHLGIHFTWSRKHRVLLHIYSWGKTPLEVLVESWLTSSVKDRDSALISRWYRVHRAFLQLLYWNWCSSRLEMGVSGNLWIFLKNVKPLAVYDVEGWMAMEPRHGKCTSSWVDLGYINQFCIPKVTSVFFSSCDSVLWDSREFCQGNRGSLYIWLGTRNSTAGTAEESGLILQRAGSLMSFLELLHSPGVYSQFTAGTDIWNSGLFSEVWTPV